MGQLLNYAEGRIAIFDTKVFDHQKYEGLKKFYSRNELEVPAGATRARRRLYAIFEGNDYRS